MRAAFWLGRSLTPMLDAHGKTTRNTPQPPLQRLGFNTTVQNPYGSIVNYLQVLDLTDHPTIPQRAWSLANDL